MISSVFSKAEYKAQSEAVQRMQKRDKRHVLCFRKFSRVNRSLVLSSLGEHILVQWSYSVEFNLFSSLVEHIELMFVSAVEFIQTYFS